MFKKGYKKQSKMADLEEPPKSEPAVPAVEHSKTANATQALQMIASLRKTLPGPIETPFVDPLPMSEPLPPN